MLVLVWVVLAGWGCVGVQGSLHCAERRDISPCTCRPMQPATRTIDVMCERMTSFGQVLAALRERFQPDVQISLKVSFSQLDDLPERGFQELGIGVSKLTLKANNLSQLPESSFSGLRSTQYLNLADNALLAIPTGVFALMPKVRTLDLSRSRLTVVRTEDFQGLPALEHLVLAGNQLNTLHKDSLPRTLRHLHLGRNQLRHLNGTLRELLDLEWLFVNVNQFTSLDEQLPESGMEKLALVFVSNNLLTRLPQELKSCPRLEVMLAAHNNIISLDGVLSRSRKLMRLELENNLIERLAEDEFAEAENIEDLLLGHNRIFSLNSSLHPIRALVTLNVTHNMLEEFSLQEIRGLQNLKTVDLSHNRIVRLIGRMENVVDSETRVEELRLEYNMLTSLEGALGGLQGLERLNLSHNQLDRISPDDLIGLDQLKVLDISHNRLRTLDETSKTFMPALEELFASFNLLESLERDFHGLPALCKADLTNNNISRIYPQLTARTRCKVHGVNSILRISLHDNPLQCDEQLARALLVFQSNLTELQGVPACALALPPMLLAPGLTLASALAAGLPMPLPMPMPVPVSVPVLPSLTPVYPGSAVVAQSPTIMVPMAFPLQPMEPILTTTTTTITTTTTTTTTTALPPALTSSTPTEAESSTITMATEPTTTTTASVETTATSTTATVSLPNSTDIPPGTHLATPSPAPGQDTELEQHRGPGPEAGQDTGREQEQEPEAGPVPEPVLKELPPLIQLLQPEVSVQPSKDLPRLMDAAELLVLAAASPPPPPSLPTPAPLAVEASPVTSTSAPFPVPVESIPEEPLSTSSSPLPAPPPPPVTDAHEQGDSSDSNPFPALEPVADAVPDALLDPPLQPPAPEVPEVPELPPLIRLLNQTAL